MISDDVLTAIKQDLRIDGNDLDSTIKRKAAFAESYITDAGCTVDYDNPKCLEIVTRLVGKAIDNPEIEAVESGFHTVGLIEQLRLSQHKNDVIEDT